MYDKVYQIDEVDNQPDIPYQSHQPMHKTWHFEE